MPLYDALLVTRPSPVVAMNRAIAVGFRDGFGVTGIDGYALLPAARADFLRRLDRRDEAAAAYRAAIALSAAGSPEQRPMRRRLIEVTG